MTFNARLTAGLTALLLGAGAPARAAGTETLTVAVAANAAPAMEEIAAAFRARTGVALALASGSSGKFSAQIRAGAPFDLFLSADADYPRALHADGFAEAPVRYARGRLILWSVKDGVDLSAGLAGLAGPGVRKIAIADPKTAPYGRAAREALEKAGVLAAAEPKLVYGESVGQTDSFIASGAADAGLTARSTAFAPHNAGRGRWVDVPASLHAPVDQDFAVLRHGRGTHPAAVDRLAAFLVSPEARAVWTRFGYEAPRAPAARAAGLEFAEPFFFGVATAPGQSEDGLDDVWLDWARRGKVAGFAATPAAERRLDSWSRPEVELDAAARAGSRVYRFGVDWGRVEPRPHEFDAAALARYRAIARMAEARGMRVMLTLMHHSVPRWAQERGGWLRDGMVDDYLEFAERVMSELHGDVAYWATFNEANVFAPLAYSVGLWPPGDRRGPLSLLAAGPLRGETVRAMDRMADAHAALYDRAHRRWPGIRVGFAHNMAYYTGKTALGRLEARYPDALLNWRFPERVRGRADFFGINYYGAEWVSGGRLVLEPDEEYSEAGRAVFPRGLYLLLKEAARRFPGVPLVVTENGIADATDVLRPAYLLEHLAAVARARDEGAPVEGYLYWTLSDNWEWADGYCPRFGLLAVDRARGLRRVPRGSYALFRTVAATRVVTEAMRAAAWSAVAARAGTPRPFCRDDDARTPLAEPRARPFSRADWRLR